MAGMVFFGGRRKGRRRRRSGGWLVSVLAVAAVAGFQAPDLLRSSAAQSIIQVQATSVRPSFSTCLSASHRTCVIDGDTIRVSGETIRLLDIDAPEVRHARCPSEKALGDRATLRLVELLNSGSLTLRREGSRDTDRYGRSLRVVEVDGRSAGSVLVGEGLARPWSGQRRPWCV
jgi:micrococcal nuclease